MYILFSKDMDIHSKSIGCSDYVKPFTVGVYVNDLNELKKIVEEETITDILDDEGRQLYIDKNHVISTNKMNGKKLTQKNTSFNVVDFAHYPKYFSLYDVMICKKQLYINQGYDDARLYEFNLNHYLDLNQSDNCDAGVNYIKLQKNGVLSLLPLKLDGSTISVKVHSDNPISVLYSYDNKNYKKGDTFKNKKSPLYIKFKNQTDTENVIYDYQILINK
jgi:hypothetical protein